MSFLRPSSWNHLIAVFYVGSSGKKTTFTLFILQFAHGSVRPQNQTLFLALKDLGPPSKKMSSSDLNFAHIQITVSHFSCLSVYNYIGRVELGTKKGLLLNHGNFLDEKEKKAKDSSHLSPHPTCQYFQTTQTEFYIIFSLFWYWNVILF